MSKTLEIICWSFFFFSIIIIIIFCIITAMKYAVSNVKLYGDQ